MLNGYLIYLQEGNAEDFCRKKHSGLKQKDSLLYQHQVATCMIWAMDAKLKPFDKKMSDLKTYYCKESEIKKRKGKRALLNPLAVRKCWKERDEKIAVLKRKSEAIRKKRWESSRRSKELWKKIQDRRGKK